MLEIIIPLALAIAYCFAGAWQLKHHQQPDRVGVLVGAVALIAHAVWLWTQLDAGNARLSITQTLSLVGMTTALIAIITGVNTRGKALAGVLFILAGPTTLATLFGDGGATDGSSGGWPLIAHIVFSIISYTLLADAATFALIMAWKERQVRRGRLSSLAARMPPIQALDGDLFIAIAAGFVILSLSIFSGLIFVSDLQMQRLTHKTLLTLSAWIVFGLLLIGRWRFGWRGMIAVRWTLIGFVCLALAYFGSRIVLELLLGRQWG